jgi:(p)ppGpp synthase/HD superfamily hydrolase
VTEENRAETMAAKLAAYARRSGANAAPIVAAYELCVARRLEILGDVFHPDLLHPARNALILIHDVECSDSSVLTAAALSETEFPAMRIELDVILGTFGPAVAELVSAVPQPDRARERLLEELVTAPDDVVLIAIAERLDHARHLHFRDLTVWPSFFNQIIDVYLPASARVSGALAARLERWSQAFERRLRKASKKGV